MKTITIIPFFLSSLLGLCNEVEKESGLAEEQVKDRAAIYSQMKLSKSLWSTLNPFLSFLLKDIQIKFMI